MTLTDREDNELKLIAIIINISFNI